MATQHQNMSSTHVLPASILVVEDEDLVRTTVVECLLDSGFNVLEAASGDEAINVLAAHDTPVNIVFTDVRMPGSVNGFDLARWVHAHEPFTGVIVTSGFVGAAMAPAGCGPLLAKPYHYPELLRRIRSLLTSGSAQLPID
jgi:CheY-like chemotaxis protein